MTLKRLFDSMHSEQDVQMIWICFSFLSGKIGIVENHYLSKLAVKVVLCGWLLVLLLFIGENIVTYQTNFKAIQFPSAKIFI